MELYLNSVYFGHGRYGVQAASHYYFGKDVEELTLSDCAILIGLLPAPAIYSPINHADRAEKRRKLVLRSMHSIGYISEKSRNAALSQPLSRSDKYENPGLAPYFSEAIVS